MPDAATANLALPLLQAAQAQKHVTHNEALVGLDTLVQLAVLDKDLTAPPASPAEGDRYLIAGASPTGAWAGWAGRVVRYQDGAWRSFVPRLGWLAFVADEVDLYTYTGVAWTSYRATLSVLQNLTRLGIGTTADATNPFAAKLNKALWTALTTGEGGTGDLRYTLNKQAAGNVLSLLLQSGFSGRAELGLTGDDDLRLKVSADGSTWREALRVEAATGTLAIRPAAVNSGPTFQGVGQPNALTILPWLVDGAYNGLTRAGDQALMWRGNGSDAPDAGGLCLIPWASSTSGVRITSAGRVGINVREPQCTLDVAGALGVSSRGSGGAPQATLNATDGGTRLAFSVNGSSVNTIYADNGVFNLFSHSTGANILSVSNYTNGAFFAGTLRPGTYTVGTLPAGAVGALAYVSNGRKIGEGAGAGTGVVASYSNGNWRRLSDDSPVAA